MMPQDHTCHNAIGFSDHTWISCAKSLQKKHLLMVKCSKCSRCTLLLLLLWDKPALMHTADTKVCVYLKCERSCLSVLKLTRLPCSYEKLIEGPSPYPSVISFHWAQPFFISLASFLWLQLSLFTLWYIWQLFKSFSAIKVNLVT